MTDSPIDDQSPEKDGDAALSESPEVAETAAEEDPWAAALAEQQEVEATRATTDPIQDAAVEDSAPAGDSVFKPLDGAAAAPHARELDIIMNVPVRLNVELGRTRIPIKQLLELTQGSVLELDGLAGDPMDILINGYLIAQGEVVVVEDKYGIRITDIITPSERVKKLNR
ncbi:MAG: flagellar motor switch protein FliN [Gammaproteobacteria bacterium]|nr:MAG: flagellar motor switch protein FliN [Gammaproteobacteria bacterium]